MLQDGSNPDKKLAQPGYAISKALTGVVAAIVAALIAGGPVLPSHGGGDGTNLAAFTTLSQRAVSPNSSSPAPTPSSTGSASMSNELRCAAGTLQLLGSSAFEPIAKDAATEYVRRCARTDPSIKISITVNMVNGVAVNNPDSAWGVSQACDAAKPTSPSAGQIIGMYDGRYNGLSSLCPRLRSHAIGALIFSVVANKQLIAEKTNIITNGSISTPSLDDIFIKHDLQGFLAVGRQAGSGTRKAFFKNVLGSASQVTDKGNCPVPTPSSLTSCTEDSTKDLLKFANEARDAIGYAESFLLNGDYPNVSSLSIDGAAPMQENVPKPYNFWVVEHLYADMVLTSLASDFLDWLPYYIHSYVPRDDFIVCADASKRLDTDCAPTPPGSLHPPSPKPALSSFDILSIGSLFTLVFLIIDFLIVPFSLTGQPRVVNRPWWQWVGWGLVAAAEASLWSAYFLGTGAPDWVVPLLIAIGAALLVRWHKLIGHPPTSRRPGIDTRDPNVMPHGGSAQQSAVAGPTPERSQQGAGSAGLAIQPAIKSESEESESAEGRQRQPDASVCRSAFVSYSHEDEKYRLQLDKWLALLKRERLISVWHDRKILPGQDWDHEIDKNLESADIVLMLVSQDFLASEYVEGREMSRAMERHRSRSATVVPIILRFSEWQKSPLGSLEALPSKGRPVSNWPDPDEAWLYVVQGLRQLISG